MEVIETFKRRFEKYLFKGKVLVITGARQVGKTTLLEDLFETQADML